MLQRSQPYNTYQSNGQRMTLVISFLHTTGQVATKLETSASSFQQAINQVSITVKTPNSAFIPLLTGMTSSSWRSQTTSMETLTQKSRRRGNADLAIAMLKGAIITACHAHYWRDGAFQSIKTVSSDVDIDLERLEESKKTTQAEKAIFRDTRAKVADVRAYMEGRPTNLSSLDDLSWVKTLKSVFERQDQDAAEASTVEKAKPSAKPVSIVERGEPSKGKGSSNRGSNDGFERQKVYGGLGGPPKD